jgi:uncharacterized protein YceK
MRRARAGWLVTSIAGALLAGCGTVLQPSGDGLALYGGVRWDVGAIRAQWGRGAGEGTGHAVRRKLVAWSLLGLDLPLSLVADTVLAPYTLVRQILCWIDDETIRITTPPGMYPPGPF